MWSSLSVTWFSLGTLVSSTNKTKSQDITEILLSGVKHPKPSKDNDYKTFYSQHCWISLCKSQIILLFQLELTEYSSYGIFVHSEQYSTCRCLR
jgi:hypothetical protein